MIVTLSFVACLIANPTDCKTVYPMMSDEQPMSIISCQRDGQIEAAKWTNEHRGYRITKVRCSIGNRPPPAENEA